MMTKRHMEQDGLTFDTPQHWETWTTKVYIYRKRGRGHTWRDAYIRIPIDLVRHLNLKNKNQVTVAIKIPGSVTSPIDEAVL